MWNKMQKSKSNQSLKKNQNQTVRAPFNKTEKSITCLGHKACIMCFKCEEHSEKPLHTRVKTRNKKLAFVLFVLKGQWLVFSEV